MIIGWSLLLLLAVYVWLLREDQMATLTYNQPVAWSEILPALEWLQSRYDAIGMYHASKETTAWTATAAFIGAMGALILHTPRVATINTCHKFGAVVLLL